VKRTVAVLTVALAGAALAACGGDRRGDGDRVDARRWTANVCDGALAWRREIESLAADVEEQVAGAEDTARLKRLFTAYFGDAVEATDRALGELDRAGTPDVEDGEAITTDVREAFGRVRETLDDAREDAESLPTDDPEAFAVGLEKIVTAMESGFEDAQQAFVPVDERHDARVVDEAFAETPACQQFARS
jgi:hypothetical protein